MQTIKEVIHCWKRSKFSDYKMKHLPTQIRTKELPNELTGTRNQG
jgi:hypothetical protein